MAGLNQQIAMLTTQRQQLRNKSRSIKDDEKRAAYITEVSGLSDKLKKLRREVWLCKDIQERSKAIKEKIHHERDDRRDYGMNGHSPKSRLDIHR
jgi:predicted  nucleic acid-binding Zn-ribbon protein